MIKQPRPKQVITFILLLSLALFVGILTPHSAESQSIVDDDTVSGHPIYDDTVSAIFAAEAARAPQAQPQPAPIAAYDKQSASHINHPSVQRIAANEASVDVTPKTSNRAPNELIFRSGYRVEAASGIDSQLSDAVAARGADAAVYSVIQFKLPFPTQVRRDLEAQGIQFYNYVDGGGLYARLSAETLPMLQPHLNSGDIRYAGIIPTEARLSQELMSLIESRAAGLTDVLVQFFDPPSDEQLAEISSLLSIEGQSLHATLPLIDGQLSNSQLLALATIPYVRWVEPDTLSQLHNMESGMMLATDVLRDSNGDSDGTGINVSVMDSGIANPYHSDLPSSRVDDQLEYFPNDDSSANDTNGHGTHVAGTIGGDHTGWLQGHAPDVNFLIYKLCCNSSNSGYPTTDVQNAFIRGALNDMHISNNSWGGGSPEEYRTVDEIVDRAVRGEYDGSDGSPQYVNVVVSTGNDNTKVKSPGGAKNNISVGAIHDGSEPNAGTFTRCVQVSGGNCIRTCTNNNDNWPPGERVCFSNFGPIDGDGDGATRVKPDVVAPGVRTRSAQPGGDYADYNGTSMATPGVAGMLAAFLDAENDDFWFTWPEAVKARLLADAIPHYNDTANYGRGIPDLYQMHYFQSGITASANTWGGSVQNTGDTDQFTFNVPSGYDIVRVVLTWPDPAGNADVANDLDLRVYANSNCSGTAIGSSSSTDDVVEFVTITNTSHAAGTWCAKVSAFSLTNGQSYGLAWSAQLAAPDLTTTIATNVTQVQDGNDIFIYTTAYNSGNTAAASYQRLRLPTGMTLQGARIYTDVADEDNAIRSTYYTDDELFSTGAPYWRTATGAVISGSPRLVRWFVEVDTSTPGDYTFSAGSYWREAGDLEGSNSANASVNIAAPTAVTLVGNTTRAFSVPILIGLTTALCLLVVTLRRRSA